MACNSTIGLLLLAIFSISQATSRFKWHSSKQADVPYKRFGAAVKAVKKVSPHFLKGSGPRSDNTVISKADEAKHYRVHSIKHSAKLFNETPQKQATKLELGVMDSLLDMPEWEAMESRLDQIGQY